MLRIAVNSPVGRPGRLMSAPKAAALRRPPPEGEEKHLGRPGVCFS